jgi:hypothetical protein
LRAVKEESLQARAGDPELLELGTAELHMEEQGDVGELYLLDVPATKQLDPGKALSVVHPHGLHLVYVTQGHLFEVGQA